MTCLAITLAMAAQVAPNAAAEWAKLPPLPDPEGFAGAFAGVSHGSLIVAGGANFPGKKPWENGAKVWSDAIFVLDNPRGTWRLGGRLPRPLGYGVSVSHREEVVIAGGSDADRHYRDVFRLQWSDGRRTVSPVQSLPRAVANGCGALVGDSLYVIGGQDQPDTVPALTSVHSLNLVGRGAKWQVAPSLPGEGRILAVAAVVGETLYVAGGASLTAGPDGKPRRTYRKDVYRLRPGGSWERVADLPHPVVAAPSPAPSDAERFYILGGDDGSKVEFRPPESHPGFSPAVLSYDASADQWEFIGKWPTPRVVTPAVRWADQWVVPSGEARPGVRSPEIWTFSP